MGNKCKFRTIYVETDCLLGKCGFVCIQLGKETIHENINTYNEKVVSLSW